MQIFATKNNGINQIDMFDQKMHKKKQKKK